MASFRKQLSKRSAGLAFPESMNIPRNSQSGANVSGVVVTPETAIRMSTVYACIRLRAETVSSLPVGAYVRRGRQRLSYASVYNDSPAWLDKPNPEVNFLEFVEQVIASMDTDGNAYVFTVRDDYGDVVEVYALNPHAVTISRPIAGGPLVYQVRVSPNAPLKEYNSSQILHIPLFKQPGELYGLGPIGACRQTIGKVLGAETFAASYFGNSANPGGVIESPASMTISEVTEMGDKWNVDHQGPYQSGKIGILTGGAQFKTLAINAQDAQLLEAQRFGVEEIARIFRIPISLLGHPVAGAMSFASVEAQNLSFVQHSLRPLLERLERAFSSLLPEKDGFIKFNLDALLRGTTSERYENYAKALHEGWLSINDIKAKEDEAPIGDAGDSYRVPLQNIDIDDAENVGLGLKYDMVAKLIDVGFEPEDALKQLGLAPIKHTGIPPIKLQQLQRIDPVNPDQLYDVTSNPAK